MTAPPTYQNPQGQAPRQLAGRRRFTTSGTGFGETPQQPQDSGALQMPQQPQSQPGMQPPSQPRMRTQRPPPAQGPSNSPTAQPGQPQQQQQGQPRPTFAQMQAQGMARPAPPQVQSAQPISGQLNQAVSQALSGGRYGLPEVQQVNDALTQQTHQEFGAQRKALDEEMARRGIGASSIAGGYMGDLQGQEDTALANMRGGLIRDAAANNAQDLNAAVSAALGIGSQGIQQGQLDLSRQLGLSGLDLQNRQLAQQGTQFNQSQGLQEKLGMGGLDLQNRQLQQQGSQFSQSNDLQKQLGLGNLDLQNRSLAQSGNQFNLQQALAEKLGLGNLDLSKQDLALRQTQNTQQYGLQSQAQTDQRNQFTQQLAQQMGIATMGDKTQNRGLDMNQSQQQLDFMMKLASLGVFPGSPNSPTPGSPNTPGSPSSNFWEVPPGQKPTADQFTQAYQYWNPGKPVPYPGSKEASDWLNSHPPSTWKPNNTTTVNFGGQQYTQQEWDTYTKSHPNWWQGSNGGSNQDLSWLRQTPQMFYNPQTAQQYSGDPVPDNSPFNQAYWDTHNAQSSQADTDKYNFNTAKNDASHGLDSLLHAGGQFTDTLPQGMTGNAGWQQGMQSTQAWITQKLKEAGYNPDGTRIRT